MAGYLNKVMLIGRLGRDPESRFSNESTSIVSFPLATTDFWTDRNTGQKMEKTEWHSISCFNRMGDLAMQYLRKGSLVYIEGKIQYSKQGEPGTKDYRVYTNIRCDNIQFLESKNSGNDYRGGDDYGRYGDDRGDGGYDDRNGYGSYQGDGGYQSGGRNNPYNRNQGGYGGGNRYNKGGSDGGYYGNGGGNNYQPRYNNDRGRYYDNRNSYGNNSYPPSQGRNDMGDRGNDGYYQNSQYNDDNGGGNGSGPAPVQRNSLDKYNDKGVDLDNDLPGVPESNGGNDLSNIAEDNPQDSVKPKDSGDDSNIDM